MSSRTYQQTIRAINADKSLSKDQKEQLKKQAAEKEYGANDAFDIGEFEQLLGRLEGSKMRQQRQKSVEGRRDIFATGLGSMMSNF